MDLGVARDGEITQNPVDGGLIQAHVRTHFSAIVRVRHVVDGAVAFLIHQVRRQGRDDVQRCGDGNAQPEGVPHGAGVTAMASRIESTSSM